MIKSPFLEWSEEPVTINYGSDYGGVLAEYTADGETPIYVTIGW